MRRLRSSLLLLLALLCTAGPVRAQKKTKPAPADSVVQFDSSAITPRVLLNADSVIESYSKQSDYIYERELGRSSSIWDSLVDWLDDLFDVSPGTESVLGGLLKPLPYILIALAVVFIAVQLAGADLTTMLRRNRRGRVGDAEEVEEQLESIDLEGRLAEAEGKHDWQRAVRWRYLLALREMERREFVVYKVGRTNREYLRALAHGELRDRFAEMTRLFEYVWYGRIPVDATEYQKVREIFVRYNSYLESVHPGRSKQAESAWASRMAGEEVAA